MQGLTIARAALYATPRFVLTLTNSVPDSFIQDVQYHLNT